MNRLSRFGWTAKSRENPTAGRGRGAALKTFGGWIGAALVCLLVSLPGWPVETLSLQTQKGAVWQLPVLLGETVTTRYIHSVERTPVEDLYYPLEGRLCQWRTRSRSHNAGLPWQTPARGRFLREDGWLVLEGGLPVWQSIRLRVGNAQLGRNELQTGQGPRLALYAVHGGELLILSCGRARLGEVPLRRVETEADLGAQSVFRTDRPAKQASFFF